jgi:2-(1,2-epoxy-1,2-dihydrophenyl)acetyl-CoA isomerase
MTSSSTSATSPVTVYVHNGVASIVLTRPERRNALDAECRALLLAAVEQVENSEVIGAAILTGEGPTFCSGQDLREPGMNPLAKGGARVSEILDAAYTPLVLALSGCRKPLVCAVNGAAFGGGVNLALACDVVVAARSARFVQPYCQLGLTADAGSSFFLPRTVGRARALGLLLLGDGIDADTAQEWGMIWKAVDNGDLSATAQEIAEGLARGPTAALASIKKAVQVSFGNTLKQQLDYERDAQRALEQTDDYRERITAFLTKRSPAR